MKLIERVICETLQASVIREGLLNPSEIGFRRECSVWVAHVILENQIRKSIKAKQIFLLATLNVAKAYMTRLNTPLYSEVLLPLMFLLYSLLGSGLSNRNMFLLHFEI